MMKVKKDMEGGTTIQLQSPAYLFSFLLSINGFNQKTSSSTAPARLRRTQNMYKNVYFSTKSRLIIFLFCSARKQADFLYSSHSSWSLSASLAGLGVAVVVVQVL